jgi:hypothetical protein
MVRYLSLLTVVAMVRSVAAEGDADAMTTEGEDLARIGEFTRAIALFKQADAIKPSAHHACLIGLVYTRRELWSQAEIFFDRCKQRASAADPLPEWFPDAAKQLDEKLHAAGIAEVDIRVAPADVRATVAISSFPPDETFSPRKIHIIPGTYTLTITASGYHTDHETVTPTLDKPTVVAVALAPLVAPPVDRSLAFYVGAGALAVGGLAFHALAVHDKGNLDDAFAANDQVTFAAQIGPFERDRAIAITCYAFAAAAGTVGFILHRRYTAAVEATLTTTSSGTPVVGFAVPW